MIEGERFDQPNAGSGAEAHLFGVLEGSLWAAELDCIEKGRRSDYEGGRVSRNGNGGAIHSGAVFTSPWVGRTRACLELAAPN